MSEKVEGLCGHRPDPEAVEEFLAATWSPRDERTELTQQRGRRDNQQVREAIHSETRPAHGQWTFQKPISFSFQGQDHRVNRFKDILLGLASILYESNPAEFWSRVRQLRSSRGKHYYTREPENLQDPREIGQSRIYVETCFSANDVKSRCYELVAAFDIGPDALSVELRSKS